MSKLPKGWALAHLAEVTFPKGQKALPSDLAEMRFIGLEEVEAHTGRVIATQSTAGLKSAVAIFEQGDLLYGRLRPYLNKVVLADFNGAASAEFLVFPPSKAIEQRYLQSMLMSQDFVAFTGLRSSGDRPRVSFDAISDYDLSLPPLAEQRRIVAKIDSLSAKSHRARERLDHIPRLVEKYKQAILAAAFRGELTETWRRAGSSQSATETLQGVRSKRRSADLSPRRRATLSNLPKPTLEFCNIPPSWEWVCVAELAADHVRSIQSGPFGSSLLHSEFQDAGYLVIGIDNVQDGFFSLGSQNRISAAKFVDLERFQAHPRDVLVTVMATIGRTCVVPDNCETAIISKHVYRVTVDERLVTSHYLMNAFRGAEIVLQQMGANIRGQTRAGLNGEIIKGLL